MPQRNHRLIRRRPPPLAHARLRNDPFRLNPKQRRQLIVPDDPLRHIRPEPAQESHYLPLASKYSSTFSTVSNFRAEKSESGIDTPNSASSPEIKSVSANESSIPDANRLSSGAGSSGWSATACSTLIIPGLLSISVPLSVLGCRFWVVGSGLSVVLSLIHISEPTRQA